MPMKHSAYPVLQVWLGPLLAETCIVNLNPNPDVGWSRLPPRSDGFFREPYAIILPNFVKISWIVFCNCNKQSQNITSLAEVIIRVMMMMMMIQTFVKAHALCQFTAEWNCHDYCMLHSRVKSSHVAVNNGSGVHVAVQRRAVWSIRSQTWQALCRHIILQQQLE